MNFIFIIINLQKIILLKFLQCKYKKIDNILQKCQKNI